MKQLWLATLLACAPAYLSGQMQMGGPVTSLKDNVLRHSSSGTSLEPESNAPPMLMRMSGKWMEMLHGEIIAAEQQQTGPRGRDKLYSVNWVMPMFQRPTDHGQWTFVGMFSLEPATITGRYYPELFQQGETAFGKAIVDGQHPHDLFMELAAIYDLKFGNRGVATFYAAPVGDPSLGPVAFPHRTSAESDPLAPWRIIFRIRRTLPTMWRPADSPGGWCGLRPQASMDASRARIAGRLNTARLIRGRRVWPSLPAATGSLSTHLAICIRLRPCTLRKMCCGRRHR